MKYHNVLKYPVCRVGKSLISTVEIMAHDGNTYFISPDVDCFSYLNLDHTAGIPMGELVITNH